MGVGSGGDLVIFSELFGGQLCSCCLSTILHHQMIVNMVNCPKIILLCEYGNKCNKCRVLTLAAIFVVAYKRRLLNMYTIADTVCDTCPINLAMHLKGTA